MHVWTARLDLPGSPEAVAGLLTDDERARAAGFRHARDGDRFAAGRGQLRALLGSYLGTDPALLRLAVAPAGKPSLDPTAHGEWLQFSVSHSDGIALFAVASDRPVGVDVERLRDGLELDRIARRAFSPRQLQRLRELGAAERRSAFFAAWTGLEASLKARGRGLAAARPQAGAPNLATLDLAPAPGYVGAVAARGRDWVATLRELPAAALGLGDEPPRGSSPRSAPASSPSAGRTAQAACE